MEEKIYVFDARCPKCNYQGVRAEFKQEKNFTKYKEEYIMTCPKCQYKFYFLREKLDS